MDHLLWSSCTQDALSDQISQLDNVSLAPSVINQVNDSCYGSSGGGSSAGGGGCGDEHDDRKVASASKNHSEAEKRRRDRINAHLATLRKLVCNSDKMDKATLLGKVVEYLKELKSETMELSKVLTVPTDSDEVIIDLVSKTVEPSTNNVFIKVSVCCEDRPDLLSEITHTLKSLRVTLVQADMTCVGGRTKCNFTLCVINNLSANEMTTLKQSLKILFGTIVSSSSWTTSSNYRIKSKRQRFFCSSDYNTKGCQ